MTVSHKKKLASSGPEIWLRDGAHAWTIDDTYALIAEYEAEGMPRRQATRQANADISAHRLKSRDPSLPRDPTVPRDLGVPRVLPAVSTVDEIRNNWISIAATYRDAAPDQLNVEGMRQCLAGFEDELTFTIRDCTKDERAELVPVARQLETVIRSRLAELEGKDS